MVSMPHIVTGASGWRLERDDRVVLLAALPGLTAYAESEAAMVRAHRCPAWTVVVPLGGEVVLEAAGEFVHYASGVVLPPGDRDPCRATEGFVAFFVDAWHVGRDVPRTVVDVPVEVATALRTWVAPVLIPGAQIPDPSAALLSLVSMLGPIGPGTDVARAVDTLRDHDRLDGVAAALGRSPSRTRAVVRDEIGWSLSELRRWIRLVRVVSSLADSDLAALAVETGFSDQPHLTRAARAVLGRTPGSVTARSASG